MSSLRFLLGVVSSTLVLHVVRARIVTDNSDKSVVIVDSILNNPQQFLDGTDNNNFLADANCPKAENIAPCNCGWDEYGGFIKCNDENITNADLERIFSQPFPNLHFRDFIIFNNNSRITELGEILINGVTFETVYITAGDLEKISPKFLANSTDTLTEITLDRTNVSEMTFPFDTLGNYSKLQRLEITNNDFIEHLPPLDAPNLTYLMIEGNTGLKSLSPGWNKQMPKLQHDIIMDGNVIQRLEKDTFTIFPDGGYFNFDLSDNQIEYIDPQAFVFPNATHSTEFRLKLGGNRLTGTLEENIYRPMLDNTGGYGTNFITFGFSSPWIQCYNCSMVWVFEPSKQEYTYLDRLEGTCLEGMQIPNLTYDWFGKNCY